MDTAATHPQSPEAQVRRSRPLASLFMDLWRETTTLVHEEAELAKADMSERVHEAIDGVRSMAIGGAILFAGLLVLLLAAVNALERALPPDMASWLSPLIVGGVVTAIGLLALNSGRHRVSPENLRPQRSIDSLRRDRELAKEHLR